MYVNSRETDFKCANAKREKLANNPELQNSRNHRAKQDKEKLYFIHWHIGI